MVTANGPDDGVCSWRAMQDGAHFIELVTPSTAMAPPSPSSTPQCGWLKSWTDIVGPRYPSTVPLGKVRRATSEEIEQTGAVVDAVLAVYRQARAKGESRG